MTEQPIQLVTGKFYVIDVFGEPGRQTIAGPFDTAEQAEREREEINIADDCIVRRYIGKPQAAK
jgi:hypothetical protein